MTTLLVAGATATLAQEALARFARDGTHLVLAARDTARAEALASRLRAGGARSVDVLRFEAREAGAGTALVETALVLRPELDAVLVAQGVLHDQRALDADATLLADSLRVNGTSAVEVLMRAAQHLEARGGGVLAAIGSGAAVRGRRCTYGYGMGKALVHVCTQGLRARLHPHGVRVVLVLPSFVDTPMTAGLPRWMRHVTPEEVGARIHAAMTHGGDVVHVPRWWRLCLAATRFAPEAVVKRSRREERFARRVGVWRDVPSRSPLGRTDTAAPYEHCEEHGG